MDGGSCGHAPAECARRAPVRGDGHRLGVRRGGVEDESQELRARRAAASDDALRLDGMLDFVVAGLSANSVPYIEGLDLQRAVHRAVVAGERPDTVILLEHPSVYTAGKRTAPDERPTDGTPVIDVDRGGKITWHGPGQLVGYPILRLAEPIDVVGYVRRLEGILIDVLVDLGVDGRRVDGRSGVWVGEPGRENKIAAIGIRVADGVTMHGFALNCSELARALREDRGLRHP